MGSFGIIENGIVQPGNYSREEIEQKIGTWLKNAGTTDSIKFVCFVPEDP